MNISMNYTLYRATRWLCCICLVALIGSNASAQLSNYSLYSSPFQLQAYNQGFGGSATGNDNHFIAAYDNTGALISSASGSDNSTFNSTAFTSSLSVQRTTTGVYPENFDVAYIWYAVQINVASGYYSFNETYSFDPGNGYAVPGFAANSGALVYGTLPGGTGMVLSYAPWQNNDYATLPASGSFGWSGYLNAGYISVEYGMLVQDSQQLGAGAGSASASVFFGTAQAVPEPSGTAVLCCAAFLFSMRLVVRSKRLVAHR